MNRKFLVKCWLRVEDFQNDAKPDFSTEVTTDNMEVAKIVGEARCVARKGKPAVMLTASFGIEFAHK